jgi:uncharacterized protein YegL
MSQIIKESKIIFSNKDIEIPELFSNKNEPVFGVLKIKTDDFIPKNRKHLLFFTNDCSASMQDVCTDGRKKIDHSNHTITNIIKLASDICKDSEIWIQVAAFDNEIHQIIPATKINKENIKELIEKVNLILPMGSTNMELALENSNIEIDNFKKNHPDFDITHILTTDGYITEGQCDNTYLSEKVDKNYTNIFIGYGLNHSAETLITLSSNKNSRYYFIDDIEKGGIVYGEIIHNILYKCLKNIRIEAINSEIYNFEKGIWTKTLDVDFLPGDVEKTYHLKSHDPFDVEVDIFGILLENDLEAQLDKNEIKIINIMYLAEMVSEDSYSYGLKKKSIDMVGYMFRQKTLEYLYEAKNTKEYKNTKNKLIDFLNSMKKYIKTKNLEKDVFYQNLCDDIFITIKTLGSQYSDMYITSRERSNGNEYSYNIIELPKNIINIFDAKNSYIQNFGALLQPMLKHDNSNEKEPLHSISKLHLNRSYTNSKAFDIMRSVSDSKYEEFEI